MLITFDTNTGRRENLPEGVELVPDTGLSQFPVSFGEDAAGNLYIAYIASGEVYRIQTAVPEPATTTLSAVTMNAATVVPA